MTFLEGQSRTQKRLIFINCKTNIKIFLIMHYLPLKVAPIIKLASIFFFISLEPKVSNRISSYPSIIALSQCDT